MEDILLNSISLQLHQEPELKDLPIYIDRVNQDFKVPAFYVYLAYAQSKKGLRNFERINENVRYSFFIVYKNGNDEMYQADAIDKYNIIRRIFRYLYVKDPVTGEKRTFHIDDIELTFSDWSMTATLRFKIPYSYVQKLETVKSMKHNIIMKEEI